MAGGPSEIQYIARVKDIVPANEAILAREPESYTGDEAGYDLGDDVVIFEPGTLYKLEDPIPYEEKAPQSRVYTELGRFRAASTTKDAY